MSESPVQPAWDHATEVNAQSTGPEVPTSGDASVTTGDIVIDAALRDLAAVDADDLDGHIEAAEALQRTLQGRLANLGE